MTDCHSVTKTGEKCKRKALPSRRYCWQHDSKWVKRFRLGGVVTILLSIIGLLADLVGLGAPISLLPGNQENKTPAQLPVARVLTSVPHDSNSFWPDSLGRMPTPFTPAPDNRSLHLCSDFVVIPYIKELRLTFYRLSPDEIVRVSYRDELDLPNSFENGVAYGNFDVVDYYKSEINEAVMIRNPIPGTWYIESDSDCMGDSPYYEIKTIIGSADFVVKNCEKNTPAAYCLDYSMKDNDGHILSPPKNPFFSPKVLAFITNPKGEVEVFEATWVDDEKIFQTGELTNIKISGVYNIEVRFFIKHCENYLESGYLPLVCKNLQEYFHVNGTFIP